MNQNLLLRQADYADLFEIVLLLREDVLGQTRELAFGEDFSPYEAAFEVIKKDPAQALMVVVEEKNPSILLGTCHLYLQASLTFSGAMRLTIEAVRVKSSHRGQGIGRWMMAQALAWGKARGAKIAQLTSNKERASAHKFYERLGFEASHLGMKRFL